MHLPERRLSAGPCRFPGATVAVHGADLVNRPDGLRHRGAVADAMRRQAFGGHSKARVAHTRNIRRLRNAVCTVVTEALR